ncbi:hypothetical protein [Orrella marina]|uniref:hypothetical protein n=1 Tax=Orrella marina TaxID=2163011 RepID=UPI00131EFE12|nr:hypothetical protein [Orrella marina]
MHYNMIVIGVSYAGMAATLKLIRARKSALLGYSDDRDHRDFWLCISEVPGF